jgi:hypothetical protein
MEFEAFTPAFAIGPGWGIRQRRDPRRLGAPWRPLRHLIVAGLGANDIRLDHDVGRSSDHEQMLDIVPAHQHQAPPSIHGCGVNHGQSGHPPTIGVGTKAVIGESAYQPRGKDNQGQHGHKRKDKSHCLHARSLQIALSSSLALVNAAPLTANEA